MNHLEDDDQAALFSYMQYIPECEWAFAIPNGGNRNAREAARLKKQGVKSGVSDMLLPLPIPQSYAGLFIEMKTKTGRPTKKQKLFTAAMIEAGYKAIFCYGFDDAKYEVDLYVKRYRQAMEKLEAV